MHADRPLRVALLGYRGEPRSGGQGVYLRHLSRELVALGHDVTVLSGPPHPELDPGVRHVPVRGLGLYEPPGPFRTRAWAGIRTWTDVREFAQMFSGTFSEPRAFTHRVATLLADQPHRFDIVHDNQSLGTGLLELQRAGFPVIATIHHPLTIDRDVSLSHVDDPRWERSIRRFYRFIGMQVEVASALPRILTVSESSRSDIAEQMGTPHDRIHVVPVGTDPEQFRPRPEIERIPGRLITTASADVPLKGLVHLIDALGILRRTRPQAHLVAVAKAKPTGPVATAIARNDVGDAVEFVSNLTDDELVATYARAEVAVIPSLYEGFSLPAVEAMACGVPVVATTGGALPEVVGESGETGILVPPADATALATAIDSLLDDGDSRARLGAAGRARVLNRFTWQHCAEGTTHHYRAVLGRARVAERPAPSRVAGVDGSP